MTKAQFDMKTKPTISGKYVLENEFIRVEVGTMNYFELNPEERYRVTIEKL